MQNIVLGSLSSRFSQFIMNYNMMGLKGGLDELLGLLKTTEEDMNKMSCNGSDDIQLGAHSIRMHCK
jgi:hypothetical protein